MHYVSFSLFLFLFMVRHTHDPGMKQVRQDAMDTMTVKRRLLMLMRHFGGWKDVVDETHNEEHLPSMPPPPPPSVPFLSLSRVGDVGDTASSRSVPVPMLSMTSSSGRPSSAAATAFLGVSPSRSSPASSRGTPSPRSFQGLSPRVGGGGATFGRGRRKTGAAKTKSTGDLLMDDYLARSSIILPGRAGLNNLGNTCYITLSFNVCRMRVHFGNISFDIVMIW